MKGDKNAASHKFQFSYPSILEELKDDELWCFLLYQFKYSMTIFNTPF